MKKVILSVCLLLSAAMSLFITVNANEQAIDVRYEIIEDANLYDGLVIECHGEIKAYKDGAFLWSYTTETASINPEVETISNIYINSDTVYVAVNHVLYALDINSGYIKWTISDVGAGNCLEFDGYGNVYISGFYGPDLVVIDKNGNELYREDNPDYSWVDELKIVGNVLNIHYWSGADGEGSASMDISQFIPESVGVILNGCKVEFDQEPVIQNGRTLVPIRAVVEMMGGSVAWDELTRTTELKYSGKTIKLTIDSNVAYLDGIEKNLDVAPQIINGRTLMPIRFVAESFGFTVDWNADTQTVIIIPLESGYEGLDLLNCIGKTKEENTRIYGEIVGAEYWLGGKYYRHDALKSLLFYDHDNYNYDINDDVPQNVTCSHILLNLSEWLKTPDKITYTIEELKNILGEYEFVNDLENEFYPLCFYKFSYGDYNITIESDHVNPLVKEATVTKK